MIEKDAKIKWCPMVHVRYTGVLCSKGEEGKAMDVLESKSRESKCLASDCMLWDWDAPLLENGNIETRSGHCGFAGGLRVVTPHKRWL